MKFRKKRYLIICMVFLMLSISTTCFAKETEKLDSKQIQEEVAPHVDVWTMVRTTSGDIGVPVGTYVPGANSYYVRLLQATLNTLGYNCGTPDGIYGTNTRNAIISFQRQNGLSVDGIAGEDTWVTAAALTWNTRVPF